MREDRQLLGARGLKTLTSKNARWCLSPQKPCARTSRRAPSSELEVLCESLSPVIGCRGGSVASDNNFAVRSLMSLCLIEGNPPHES